MNKEQAVKTIKGLLEFVGEKCQLKNGKLVPTQCGQNQAVENAKKLISELEGGRIQNDLDFEKEWEARYER